MPIVITDRRNPSVESISAGRSGLSSGTATIASLLPNDGLRNSSLCLLSMHDVPRAANEVCPKNGCGSVDKSRSVRGEDRRDTTFVSFVS